MRFMLFAQALIIIIYRRIVHNLFITFRNYLKFPLAFQTHIRYNSGVFKERKNRESRRVPQM